MAEMKEILVANLTLDTTRRNNIPPLIVPQGDYGARVIKAKITVLGKPVTVPNTASVSIVADRNGDSEALAFSGKVNEDGSVTVPVTQWMLDAPENYVTCHIEATGIDYKYSTTHFLIEPEKKANPTEITPDDPRKDVVTEVLAGEKERVLAEGIRSLNENARKRAEEARVSAEEQRLTDEATRVANESERVSSELSRDATFKGWAQDIASLPSFDSRISANSDRLTNIEAGLPSSVWHVDDTAARVKDVPENARPKAIVNKIGGMTRKCTNLWDEEWYNASLNENTGVFTEAPTADVSSKNFISVLPNTEYYKSVSALVAFYDNSKAFISASSYSAGVLTTPNDCYFMKFQTFVGNYGTVYKNDIIISEGSTALPYEPYFEGLRSAKVTAVKSVGRNLIPYPYEETTKIVNGITFTDNGDGSITLNGTNSTEAYAEIILHRNLKLDDAKDTLTFSMLSSEVAGVRAIVGGGGYSYNEPRIKYTLYKQNDTGVVQNLRIRVDAGATVSKVTVYPMINAGSTAQPYTPYVEHTLPIPEELRPANGINAEVYDSIELNENGSVTKRVKCGVVDMGTLDWGYSEVYMQFSCELPSKAFGRKNMKCAPYNIIDRDGYASGLPDMSMHGHISVSKVYVTNLSYSDAATFKAAMSGVMLVYELAEPIVTDTYADFIIDVEGGGTLTFEDEHGYDMPNTVTYMLKEVTA